MERIYPNSKDITEENIDKITALFPQVLTEKEDEQGNIVKAIDFELLKQHLSKDLAGGTDERYRLDWPGKRRSILKANTPINKTLVPDRESSVNFDMTQNLYLEGDNFEVLKILQEGYLGKIKMIYIDPPYNTGKDFVYKDNFTVSKEEYEDDLGITDDEGGRLVKNTDTNGRFHSDWLSMMHERLLVARDLLTEDGVIFMSIDDNEVHNLRKIGDEIFGEHNFLSQFPRITKKAGKTTDTIAKNTDYILGFSKTSNVRLFKKTFEDKEYKYSDEHFKERGNYKLSQTLDYDTLGYIASLDYPILIDGYTFYPGGVTKEQHLKRKKEEPKDGHRWRWSKNLFDFGFENGFIVVKESSNGKRLYTKTYKNAIISKNGNSYFVDKIQRTKATSTLEFIENKYSNDNSRKDLSKIFDNKVFEYSKPISLLKELSFIGSEENDIIFDFFSGSATTAQAILQLNAEDGGNRRFIMAQIPEETDEKSEAYKAGYKTITEIGKERIRRAGQKILEDYKEELKKRDTPLDVGFRVYKTSETIFKDVAKNPAAINQQELFNYQDNIKDTASPEDILTTVLLDFGLTLDNKIEVETIAGAQVFKVEEDALVACFDKEIDMQVVEEMAKIQPLRAVFRDACFKDDKDLINTVESHFKQISPDTIVHVI